MRPMLEVAEKKAPKSLERKRNLGTPEVLCTYLSSHDLLKFFEDPSSHSNVPYIGLTTTDNTASTVVVERQTEDEVLSI